MAEKIPYSYNEEDMASWPTMEDESDQSGGMPVPVDDIEGPQPFNDLIEKWSTPPADGNWQQWFLNNVQGLPANSQTLAGLKDILKQHNIEVLTNASGIAGKIKLPDGSIVDVGRAFSSNDPSQMQWQWLTGAGDGGSWFDVNAPAPEVYTALQRPDHLAKPYQAPQFTEQFTAPTLDELYADSGYRARLDAAQKASERSAAAKGSILSGGFQNALGRSQQEIASQGYGDLFNRKLGGYQQRLNTFATNAGLDLGGRTFNESAFQNDVLNNLNQYNTRYRSYRDLIGDQFRLADLGLSATTAGA